MKTLLAAISVCALFASCSTIKVTPAVADRIARREPPAVIEHEIVEASDAEAKAQERAVSTGKALIAAVHAKKQIQTAAPDDPDQLIEMAKSLVDAPEATPGTAADFRVASIGLETERAKLERLTREREMLYEVTLGGIEDIVDKTWYFSIEPAVALKNGFNAVATPSLGVNCRPFGDGEPFSAWAVQLLLGGALNPNDEGDQGTTGAVGLGLSHPIGGTGAFSFGAIGWDDDGDGRVSPYFSITLGDFAKPVPKN